MFLRDDINEERLFGDGGWGVGDTRSVVILVVFNINRERLGDGGRERLGDGGVEDTLQADDKWSNASSSSGWNGTG